MIAEEMGLITIAPKAKGRNTRRKTKDVLQPRYDRKEPIGRSEAGIQRAALK